MAGIEILEKYADVDKNGLLTASDAAFIVYKVMSDGFIMPAEN